MLPETLLVQSLKVRNKVNGWLFFLDALGVDCFYHKFVCSVYMEIIFISVHLCRDKWKMKVMRPEGYHSNVPMSCYAEVGWRAVVTPTDHPVSEYVFDVCISADGKRNTLQGMYIVVALVVAIMHAIKSLKTTLPARRTSTVEGPMQALGL